MKKKIVNVLGKLVIIASIYYIISSIIKNDIDWKRYIMNPTNMMSFILVIGMLVVSVHLSANVYRKIIFATSKVMIPKNELQDIYISSNMGKYLPGNVMHLIGRNLLGSKYNISHKSMISATIIELFLIIFSAFVLVVTLGNKLVLETLKMILGKYSIAIYMIGMCVIIVGIIIAIKFRKRVYVEIKEYDLKELIKCAIKEIGVFIILPVTFCIVTITLSNRQLGIKNIIIVFCVYSIAWLIGFIMPGIPGGIGVREWILTVLLQSIIPNETILASVIIHRSLSVIADGSAFIILKARGVLRES